MSQTPQEQIAAIVEQAADRVGEIMTAYLRQVLDELNQVHPGTTFVVTEGNGSMHFEASEEIMNSVMILGDELEHNSPEHIAEALKDEQDIGLMQDWTVEQVIRVYELVEAGMNLWHEVISEYGYTFNMIGDEVRE